ncbi:hypothetical protein B0T09DRAFT_111637 [Sordaria sp. MPI-SDFR-AT-0083]|nr:hypothetical protein B0T09DRAFT_111637 [Sordaria sp. MPI-SDFR-AT-0083]
MSDEIYIKVYMVVRLVCGWAGIAWKVGKRPEDKRRHIRRNHKQGNDFHFWEETGQEERATTHPYLGLFLIFFVWAGRVPIRLCGVWLCFYAWSFGAIMHIQKLHHLAFLPTSAFLERLVRAPLSDLMLEG